jgi:hypothetical protein
VLGNSGVYDLNSTIAGMREGNWCYIIDSDATGPISPLTSMNLSCTCC